MNVNKDQEKRDRAGFSMIEVLVASTILVVIVMMLGMLFQQTSLAWRTGVRRADSFRQVRSLVGAIQRDASAAVDAREIPATLKSAVGGSDQKLKAWPLQFYTLTGKGFVEDNPSKLVLRALSYITYEDNGLRKETVLGADGNGHNPNKEGASVSSSKLKQILKTDDEQTTTLSDLKAVFLDDDTEKKGLPLFLTFTVKVKLSKNSYEIGAASAGPDKVWGTKDDIRTWLED